MVGRKGRDNLSRSSDEIVTSLLRLDGTQQAEEVNQHGAMRKFGLVINTINLATVLWDGGERKDAIEIEVESRVVVVDKGVYVLFRPLVEGNDGESGSPTAERLEYALVVLHTLATVP